MSCACHAPCRGSIELEELFQEVPELPLAPVITSLLECVVLAITYCLALRVLGFPHGSPARAPTVEKDSTALRAPLEYHSMPLDYRHPSKALRVNEDIDQCVPQRSPATHFQHTTDRFRLPYRTFRRFCQHWSSASDYPLAQSGPSTAEPGPIRAWEARQPRSTTIAAFLVQHRRKQLLSSYG